MIGKKKYVVKNIDKPQLIRDLLQLHIISREENYQFKCIGYKNNKTFICILAHI